jgi:hypothetical protein
MRGKSLDVVKLSLKRQEHHGAASSQEIGISIEYGQFRPEGKSL